MYQRGCDSFSAALNVLSFKPVQTYFQWKVWVKYNTRETGFVRTGFLSCWVLSVPRPSLVPSKMIPKPTERTHDISLTNYHIKDLKAFGETLTDAVAGAFPNKGRSRYSEVHVLLLSWEEDNLGVITEGKRTEYLFLLVCNSQCSELLNDVFESSLLPNDHLCLSIRLFCLDEQCMMQLNFNFHS